MLYAPILGLVKASTLVLMLRIAGHMKDFRRAIYVSQEDDAFWPLTPDDEPGQCWVSENNLVLLN